MSTGSERTPKLTLAQVRPSLYTQSLAIAMVSEGETCGTPQRKDRMKSRWARVARGLVTAVISVFLAAFSHIVFGGALPGLAGILLSLAFAGVICVLLAGQTLSRLRLSVAVFASQFTFHAFFSLLIDATPAGATVVNTTHEHLVPPVLFLIPAPSLSAMPMSSALTMWLGHAIGALITIVVLLHAERAFWGLSEVATLMLARLFAFIVPITRSATPGLPTLETERAALPHYRSALVDVQRDRGPPARFAL